MDEISLGSPRGPRWPPPRHWSPQRWILVAVAVAVALSVPSIVHAARHPARPPASPGPASPATTIITAPPPAGETGPGSRADFAAVGTALVGCDALSWWNLGSTWQPGSVRAGPLWLLNAQRIGYAQPVAPGPGTAPGPSPTVGPSPAAGASPAARGQNWAMIVHVEPGARVVMRGAAGTSGLFHFIDGPPGPSYAPDSGVPGLTFASCGKQSLPAGWIGLYQLTFYIVPGESANVEVLTSTSPTPYWLRFRAPR